MIDHPGAELALLKRIVAGLRQDLAEVERTSRAHRERRVAQAILMLAVVEARGDARHLAGWEHLIDEATYLCAELGHPARHLTAPAHDEIDLDLLDLDAVHVST